MNPAEKVALTEDFAWQALVRSAEMAPTATVVRALANYAEHAVADRVVEAIERERATHVGALTLAQQMARKMERAAWGAKIESAADGLDSVLQSHWTGDHLRALLTTDDATALADRDARIARQAKPTDAGVERLLARLLRVTEHRDVRRYGEEGTPYSNGAKRMAVAVRAEFEALFRDPHAQEES